jgi:hypothetical protein
VQHLLHPRYQQEQCFHSLLLLQQKLYGSAVSGSNVLLLWLPPPLLQLLLGESSLVKEAASPCPCPLPENLETVRAAFPAGHSFHCLYCYLLLQQQLQLHTPSWGSGRD